MDSLPPEIAVMVLNVHLEKPWRPLAARVCHAWRAIVALDVENALKRVTKRQGKTHIKEVYYCTQGRANPLFIGKHTLAVAAAGSHIRLLRWLLSHPRVCASEAVVSAAAFVGAIGAVAFFANHRPSLVRGAPRYAAARGGQRRLLEWFLARDRERWLQSAFQSDDDDDDDDSGQDWGGSDDEYLSASCSGSSFDSAAALCFPDGALGDGGTVAGDAEADAADEDDTPGFFDRDRIRPVWHVDEDPDSSDYDYSGELVTDEDEADVGETREWWGPYMCASAAKGGHLDLLVWLRGPDVRCRWDSRAVSAAAAGGHPSVLRWMLLECDPPCPIDHKWAIRWAAGAPTNNVGALEAIVATGYSPQMDDLREVLSWGQTEMADSMLRGDPSLAKFDEIEWWRNEIDEEREGKDTNRRVLEWVIGRLDEQPSLWNRIVEIALTYAAIVGKHTDIAESLRVRGRLVVGDTISDDEAQKIGGRNKDGVKSVIRTGSRGY